MSVRSLGQATLAFALLGACSGAEPGGTESATAGGAGTHAGGTGSGGHAGTAGESGSSSDAGTSSGSGGDTDGAAGESSSDGPTPHGGCRVDKRLGRFAVERQKDFGVVQGTLLDGVVPTSIPEVVAEQDSCKLLRRRNLSCSPACSSAETCGEQGQCVPYPHQIGVGTVTLDGLTKRVSMEPQQPGAVYFAPGQDNPPFSPDARVTLAATGSPEIGPFKLFAHGSVALTEAPSWVLEENQPLELSWPAGSEATTVAIELTIDQHGSSPLSLACDLPDTGSGTVPAALVQQLIGSGVSGFPNGRLQRHSVDHVDTELGCVELSVGSVLAARVRVAGVTPCHSEDDCPSGTTCDLQQELCH